MVKLKNRIYENILYDDANDCKAEWMYALSKHEVAGENEEEMYYFSAPPSEPFSSDVNYKQLCERISGHSRESNYRSTAARLDSIRARYLEIQKKGVDYQICLCVPEDSAEYGQMLKQHLLRTRDDLKIFTSTPDTVGKEAEICYAVHTSKVLVMFGKSADSFEGTARSHFWKPFSVRDGVQTVAVTDCEPARDFSENVNIVRFGNGGWLDTVAKLIEKKLPGPKIIVQQHTVVNNVSEIHIKETIDHTYKCFMDRQYKEAYEAAEKVLGEVTSCPPAEYAKAFYLAVVQNTVHRNALHVFFKNSSSVKISESDAALMKNMFLSTVYQLLPFEEAAVRMILGSGIPEAGAFADSFCSKLVAKQKDSRFMTQSLQALYSELAGKYTMQKLCLALISATKTNPDSPIHGNSFHLKTKATYFRQSYFVPVGEIISNMNDVSVRKKYQAVYRNELAKYDAKLK